MSKETYLDIEWTTALLNKTSLESRGRRDGLIDFDSLHLPNEMLIWLKETTGSSPLQTSYISESQWWWDKFDNTRVKFYFRDPDVAVRFKLTWGGDHVSSRVE